MYDPSKTIDLTRTIVRACKSIPRVQLTGEGLKVDSMWGQWADDLVLTLWGYFDTEEVDHEDVTFTWRTYASWWEDFKDHHMPGRYVKRWPVKWKDHQQVIPVTHTCVFPKATVLPDYKQLVFRRDIKDKCHYELEME